MAAENTCLNCHVYGWTPSEAEITSRCSRCKLFYYCSKECQVEHYKKTHKHFCKAIFAPTTARLQHDETTCRYCILEASAGNDVFKDDNPYYVCVENPSNALLCNIPKENILSYIACSLTTEATGNDGKERPDRLIMAMQRLLVKMRLTGHAAFKTFPSEMEEVATGLLEVRDEVFMSQQADIKSYQTRVFYMAAANPVSAIFHKIGCLSDCLKTWETYLALTELLILCETVRLCKRIKSPEKSLCAGWENASGKVDVFLKVVDQILEALEYQVVPYNHIVAIACQGTVEQKCSSCHSEIKVTRIHFHGVPNNDPVILLSPVHDPSYSCGSEECAKKVWIEKRGVMDTWATAVAATVAKLSDFRCDFCFLLVTCNEIHRSLCKTKNYCSAACRNADDSVHEVCCGQGLVEERKVKKGGKEKPALADQNISLFSSLVAEGDEGVSEESIKKVLSKVNKLRLKNESKAKLTNSEVD